MYVYIYVTIDEINYLPTVIRLPCQFTDKLHCPVEEREVIYKNIEMTLFNQYIFDSMAKIENITEII